MYYNGNNKYDVAQFLGMVHADLKDRYIWTVNRNTEHQKASIMTNFFQSLKTYFQTGQNVKDDLDAAFFESIKLSARTKGKSINTFFTQLKSGSETGASFEKEIAKIMDVISGDKGSKSLVGGESAYQTDVDSFLQDYYEVYYNDKGSAVIKAITDDLEVKVLKGTMKAVAPKTVRLFNEEEKKKAKAQRQYRLYFQGVDQKVDINNNQIKFSKTWEVSPQTQQALDALKTATFTAKSYKKGDNLKIGETNAIRAYFSTLDGLGYHYKVKSSSFLHALALCTTLEKNKNNRTQRAKDVGTYVYQMRFIYELTGIGQKGLTANNDYYDLAEADYLLYNESTGSNIYVYSTKDIIGTMYNNIRNFESFGRDNPFKGTMYIRLDWLGLQSNYTP